MDRPFDHFDASDERARAATLQKIGVFAIFLGVMLYSDIGTMLVHHWLGSLTTFSIDSWVRTARRYFDCVMFGTYAAQLILLALYAALGDGRSPMRVLYTTFAVAVCANCLTLFSMWLFELYWSDSVFIFLLPTLFFFLLQVPFWAGRVWLGWNIRSPWNEPVSGQPFRFSLAHMLSWSAFLAVPLLIMSVIPEMEMGGEMVLVLFYGSCLCVLVLGLTYVSLREHRFRSFNWLVLAAGTVFSILLEIAILGAFGSSRPTFQLIVVNSFGALLLALGLQAAYWFGFRLVLFRDRSPSSSYEPAAVSHGTAGRGGAMWRDTDDRTDA